METLAASLVEKAVELGATVAGLTSVSELRGSPSHDGIPVLETDKDGDAVLVLGLHHPPSQPELDLYTGKGGTEGNRILIRINKNLIAWLHEGLGIEARDLPYYVEHGGIYLKDAAVLAGLGAVGVNNLMIVPEYGPHIRFRALLVHALLPPTGRVEYSPCEECQRPCLAVCTEGALVEGSFDREACLNKMRDASRVGAQYLVMDPSKVTDVLEVSFCRMCELACPIGAGGREKGEGRREKGEGRRGSQY
jgi:epoxyqueuosine reductase